MENEANSEQNGQPEAPPIERVDVAVDGLRQLAVKAQQLEAERNELLEQLRLAQVTVCILLANAGGEVDFRPRDVQRAGACGFMFSTAELPGGMRRFTLAKPLLVVVPKVVRAVEGVKPLEHVPG